MPSRTLYSVFTSVKTFLVALSEQPRYSLCMSETNKEIKPMMTKISVEHDPGPYTFTIRINGEFVVSVHNGLLRDAHLFIIERAYQLAGVTYEVSPMRMV